MDTVERFTRTILSALSIQEGMDALLKKDQELIDVNVKIPKASAEVIFNCVKCFAKRGEIEGLFDEFFLLIFKVGVRNLIIQEFKQPENYIKYMTELIKTDCGACALLNNKDLLTELAKK